MVAKIVCNFNHNSRANRIKRCPETRFAFCIALLGSNIFTILNESSILAVTFGCWARAMQGGCCLPPQYKLGFNVCSFEHNRVSRNATETVFRRTGTSGPLSWHSTTGNSYCWQSVPPKRIYAATRAVPFVILSVTPEGQLNWRRPKQKTNRV